MKGGENIKRLGVILIIGLITLIMIPFTAFAYTGGLLNGVTGTWLGGDAAAVTDNDELTSITLTAFGTSNSEVTFNAVNGSWTINQYQLKSNSDIRIRFFDINGNQIYDAGATTSDGTLKSITPVSNVTKIKVFNGIAGSSETLSEFDVFGSFTPAPDTTAPSVPSGITTTSDVNNIDVQWTANSDDTTGYNLYLNGVKNNSSLITGTTYSITSLAPSVTYQVQLTAVDAAGNESAKSTVTTATTLDDPAMMHVNLVPNGTSIIVYVDNGQLPYTVTWDTFSKTFSGGQYNITGLELNTDYTITVTDTNGQSYTGTVNTGSKVGYAPAAMPDSTSIFQSMLDNFGDAGNIALIVIGAAVSLGVLVILGMWGWRLSKKWLHAAK